MKMTDPENLPYRPCVGVMLVNADGMAFVGKRIDNKEGDWWQMPQGGIDKGEDIREAALRELGEETGLMERHVTIIAQTREELFYDLPDELIGKLWKGKYRGQRQHAHRSRGSCQGRSGTAERDTARARGNAGATNRRAA